MLKAKVEIMFTKEGKTYEGDCRPAFNFGNDLLFSGAVMSPVTEYLPKQKYIVDVAFFTISSEGYEMVKSLLKPNMGMTMQEGSRIIGVAKLLEYTYASELA